MRQKKSYGSDRMANKVSKRLVIDASVARSAGEKDPNRPESVSVGGEDAKRPELVSVYCRNFLQTVLDICHRVAMTRDIRDEWDKHQSKFAIRWLKTMVAKKKLVCIEVPIDDQLWKKIEDSVDLDKDRYEMVKDLRLLEAAIATDKTIISLDNKVRKLFKRAASEAVELESIVWVNPGIPEEKVISWLENGANTESDRLLKNYLEPK
jgi:hypothetical protein